MTTHLTRVEANAHERAMDPDLSVDDVLRAVSAALTTPPSTMTSAEVAANRAMLRGTMRAWLKRTGAETGEAGGVPADGDGDATAAFA